MEEMDKENLPQLLTRRLDIDRAIEELKERRNLTNEQILDKMTYHDEGSHTVEIEGFKVTTTATMRRNLDPEVWEEIKDEIPEDCREVVSYTPKLSIKLYKEIEKHRPEVFCKIAEAVTTKPGATAVKIKELN
jgi:hypothetical protein